MGEEIIENSIILKGEDLELVEGYLRIENGVIKEIEEGDPVKSGTNLNKSIIIPPFFNAHTHIGDSVVKEIYGSKSQPEVVGECGKKFEILESASKKKIVNSIKESLLEMRESGTFAFCDFREEGINGVNLIKEAQNEIPKSIILSRPTIEEEIEELLIETDGIGISSLDCYSSRLIEKISKGVMKKNKHISLHVSETEKAHKKSIEETGKTEIERALNLNPSFLVHGTWASEKDLELLRDDNVPLVMCPRSNSLLSCGIPPIKKAMDKEVELWLGTDNVSVCSPIILDELSFAWSILRLQSEDAGEKEAKELLKAATINPTKKMKASFGSIECGSKAAFVVLERKRNLTNCENLYMGIVNRARVDNIKSIYYPRENV